MRDDGPMDLDPEACYRAIATRDARFDGRLFIAVKTTGIYCRPICPTRTPKRENLVFYPSAAAAQEAGFRPCLRCRPESAPDIGVWRGTSNTVSRALALIEKGGLDGADVEALAERLGVGERQLRRLFRRHLGASPDRGRADPSRAPGQAPDPRDAPADVRGRARGGLRQHPPVQRDLPAALRPAAEHAAARGAGGADRTRRGGRDPASVPAALRLAGHARVPPGPRDSRRGDRVEDGYARTIEIGGAHGTVAVRPAARNALRAAIQFPQLSALPTIVARLRRVFDLIADPEVIGAHLSEDPALAPLVAARPGLRVAGAWDGFELAVRALLGQQITVTAARSLAGRLVATYGKPLAGGGEGLTHVFPGAERLADADLSTLGLTRARAAALGSLARAVVADPQIFGPRRTLEEAIVKLRALPGIGEWTAQYIAMREMREPDAFPAADIGLMRAMADRKGRRPTPARCSRAPSAGGPGARTPRNTCGRPRGCAMIAGRLPVTIDLLYGRSTLPVTPPSGCVPTVIEKRADAGAGRAAGRRRARAGRARRQPGAA